MWHWNVKRKLNHFNGLLFIVLVTLPLTTSTNIDCLGKAFHCVNSTHFMICVDIGAGFSSTIDDFVIPCPPTTVCQHNNRFECEFAPTTTQAPTTTTVSYVKQNMQWPDATKQTHENIISSTFLDVTTIQQDYNTISTTTLANTDNYNEISTLAQEPSGTQGSSVTDNYFWNTSPLHETTHSYKEKRASNSINEITDITTESTPVISDVHKVTDDASSVPATTSRTSETVPETISELPSTTEGSTSEMPIPTIKANFDISIPKKDPEFLNIRKSTQLSNLVSAVEPTTEMYLPDATEINTVTTQNLPVFDSTLATVTESTYTNSNGDNYDTSTVTNSVVNSFSEQANNDVLDLKPTTEAIYAEPVFEINKELIRDPTVENPSDTLNISVVNLSTTTIDRTFDEKSLGATVELPSAISNLASENQKDATTDASIAKKSITVIDDNIATISTVLNNNFDTTEPTSWKTSVHYEIDRTINDATTIAAGGKDKDTLSNDIPSDITETATTKYINENEISDTAGSDLITNSKNTEKVVVNNSLNTDTSGISVTGAETKQTTLIGEISKDLKTLVKVDFDTTLLTTTSKTSQAEKKTENNNIKISESLVEIGTPSYDTVATLESSPSDTTTVTESYNNEYETTPLAVEQTPSITTNIQSVSGVKLNNINTPSILEVSKPELSISVENKEFQKSKAVSASNYNVKESEQTANKLNDEAQSTTSIPTEYYTHDTSPIDVATTSISTNTVAENNTPLSEINAITGTQLENTVDKTKLEMNSVVSVPSDISNDNSLVTSVDEGVLKQTITSNTPLDPTILLKKDDVKIVTDQGTIKGNSNTISVITADEILSKGNTQKPSTLSTTGDTKLSDETGKPLIEAVTLGLSPTLSVETKSFDLTSTVSTSDNETNKKVLDFADTEGTTQKLSPTQVNLQQLNGEIVTLADVPGSQQIVQSSSKPVTRDSTTFDYHMPSQPSVTAPTLKVQDSLSFNTKETKEENNSITSTKIENTGDSKITLTIPNKVADISSDQATTLIADRIITTKETIINDQILTNPSTIKQSGIQTKFITTPISINTLKTPEEIINDQEITTTKVISETNKPIVTVNKISSVETTKQTVDEKVIPVSASVPSKTIKTGDPKLLNEEEAVTKVTVTAAKQTVDEKVIPVSVPIPSKTIKTGDQKLLNEEEAVTKVAVTATKQIVDKKVTKKITQNQITINSGTKIKAIESESISPSLTATTINQASGINKNVGSTVQGDTKVELSTLASHKNSGATKSTQVVQNDITTKTVFKPSFTCRYQNRGRYGDEKDCRKFYICIGRQQPIVGMCPVGTVFSVFKKQCTKNLSFCVRNNQFQCVSRGRYGDLIKNNIYYICIRTGQNTFVRYTFQCQKGYYLNKTSTTCLPIINTTPKKTNEEIVAKKSDEDKSSRKHNDKSANQNSSAESELIESICDDVGKYADPEDCRVYYICYKDKKSEMKLKIKKCESDEVFHKEKKKCVDTESYECNTN